MEHAMSTGVLPDFVDCENMSRSGSMPLSERVRFQPRTGPRRAKRGAFWLAELCGLAFAIIIIQSLCGDMIKRYAMAPFRSLSEHYSQNIASKYATSLRGIGIDDFSHLHAETINTNGDTLSSWEADNGDSRPGSLPTANQNDSHLQLTNTVDDTNIEDQKGYLCMKIPSGPLPSTYLSPTADATVEETPEMIMAPFLKTLDTPLSDDDAVRADGTCGDAAGDTTVIILLYHKMGTVWWNNAMRTSDFAHWGSVFTVDSGAVADDAMDFLEIAADLAATHPKLSKKFPSILMVNNPTLENVHKLYEWTVKAGRKPKILLQVRDFRDVLVSGYKYHKTHKTSDVTSEAWLHKPETYWGEAIGSKEAVSYQDALLSLSLAEGATLEMEMVESVWQSIALVAHDPVLSKSAAFVTYEKMWFYPGNVITQLVSFLYGDVRCNESANKLARGFLAYTAGFRMYTAAGEAAHKSGTDFKPESVDLKDVISLIKAEGKPVESEASVRDLTVYFRTTYGNAGKHFRSGTPGKWKEDDGFNAHAARVFSERFQCLLDAFQFEKDDSWVQEKESQEATESGADGGSM